MPATSRTPKKVATPRDLSAAELMKGLPAAKAVEFEPGVYIFTEGSHAHNCYVITSGKVNILKRNEKGHDSQIATAKAGEFLGEMAMLAKQERTAGAVALTKVKAICIEHDDLVHLLGQQHPFANRLALQLARLLAERCHNLLLLIAKQSRVVPLEEKPVKKVQPDINQSYALWAI
jgi:CRP-like cAMP-binding protein